MGILTLMPPLPHTSTRMRRSAVHPRTHTPATIMSTRTHMSTHTIRITTTPRSTTHHWKRSLTSNLGSIATRILTRRTITLTLLVMSTLTLTPQRSQNSLQHTHATICMIMLVSKPYRCVDVADSLSLVVAIDPELSLRA